MDKIDMALAALIALVVCTVLGTMAGTVVESHRRTELLAEMVKNGVPPLEARCALSR